jgi:hypothetical protein
MARKWFDHALKMMTLRGIISTGDPGVCGEHDGRRGELASPPPSDRAHERGGHMRRILISVAALVIGAGMAATAFAASVHFKHGSPTFTDNGLTLTENVSLTGLGNGDLLVTLNATANPTAVCTNPGGNEAPGQNPASVNVTGSTAVPSSQIKNGNVSFGVTTNPPAQPTPQQAGCPNGNWSATITDMAFTSATLTVQQNGVTVLGPVTCTFSPPTSDGSATCS